MFARGDFEHVGDGGDAGDGILGKVPGVGDGTDKPLVDVHRAAAHAPYYARVRQRAAGEPGEDHVHARPQGSFKHPQDFDLEGVDLSALEGRQPKAAHASAQLAWLHERLCAERGSGQ